MMTIGDETLIAFADGELTGIRRAELERALAEDPELRSRLERQQRLRARIAGHYAPVEDEPVPDRLTAMLAASEDHPADDNVVDFAAAKQRRARPLWQSLTALAATLVLGLLAGQMLPGGEGGPVAVESGRMVARGDLADALDRRLAGDQGGATRIGVSFAAADGRFCRTFDGAEMSGLACRGDAGWQLVATAPGTGAAGAEYRQASSGNALVLGAAQEMMAGEPLDVAGERRARDSGWRNPPARD
jgi:plasmid stability protein